MTAAPATPAGFAAPTASWLLVDYAAGRRPTEVLVDCLATIKATEPTINAVVELLEDATDAAAVADDQWATGEAPAGKPLLGVPVVIKEKHGVAGRRLDQAVPATAEIPERDHPIVERLRAAGAILVARTTNPEFCAATTTDSLAHGVTRNPWNQ